MFKYIAMLFVYALTFSLMFVIATANLLGYATSGESREV